MSLYNEGMGYGTTTTWCLDNYQGRESDGNSQIMWPCTDGSSGPMHYAQGGSSVSNNAVMVHTEGNLTFCISSLGNNAQDSPIKLWKCNVNAPDQAWQSWS